MQTSFPLLFMDETGGMSKSAKQIYEMIILASRDNGTLWPMTLLPETSEEQ